MREGYAARRQTQQEDLAWLAAQIVNISGKVVTKAVKPADLLGRETKPKRKIKDG